MRIGSTALVLCAGFCFQASYISAQSRTLTLAEVLARAREQAPQVVSARLALEETRGRLVGASLRFQSNPELEGAVGNRRGPDTRFTDFEIGLRQTFEPGSRRSARAEAVTAAMAQGSAELDEATRLVLRAAATAYYRALHAAERITLLTTAQEVATGVYSVADRRFKVGDIAVLDVEYCPGIARARALSGRQRRRHGHLRLGNSGSC